jgi:serine/threonine protein kinase/tetratricopeptide (TPR) repeat protein
MEDGLAGRVRLGGFELDLHTGELCPVGGEDGTPKKLLREQPFQVLCMLVASHGKIVTREAIKKKLWPNDTIVDFDHSINVAIRILRQALGDSADEPRYIETLARRGYRLRVPVEWLQTTVGTTRPKVGPRSFPGLAGLAGKRVSHYRVLEVIGGGGMGMVYKAEDLKLGRRVALKFLPDELAADPVALRRFEREAQSASALNHPNICTIHGIDECEGQPFIVMELLEGQSLLENLNAAEERRIPLPVLLEVAMQISGGLQAAHEKGIIHRDIKPANIFVTRQGIAKILDFGLAKLAAMEAEAKANAEVPPASAAHPEANGRTSGEITPGLTRTGSTIGTARYMSPEQIRKEPLDPRTDLFSFGLVLFEMATGSSAFQGETEAALHDAILHQATPSARDLNSAVPRGLDAVIVKALEKDRAQRYQSAAEMRVDLERVRQGTNPWRRRARQAFAYAALLLVAASAAWMYWDYRSRITLSPSDTLVLADTSNHTSDTVLDDALPIALHTGLEQTPYLNILASDKVFGNLAQLGLHLDAKITPEIARQICLRTNSKMMVTSSIADAGNRFQIELDAVGCQNQENFARVQQDALKREDIVHALGVGAVQLRRKLGEPSASIAQFNEPLELAASSSPEALQLLTEGYRHHIVNDLQNAESLYQRAIEVDPNFALAYSALGAAYQSANNTILAAPSEEKAYALRDHMTVPGRFQAETGYYDLVTGEVEKSAAVYAQWLKLFPQNLIARVNYAYSLSRLGQADESARYWRDVTRDLPSSAFYQSLMRAYMMAGRLDEAKAAFEEGEARKVDDLGLRLNRATLAFLQRDNAALAEQWQWAARHPNGGEMMLGKARIQRYYGQFRAASRLTEDSIKQIKTGAPNQDFTEGFADEAIQEAVVGNAADARRAAEKALAGPQQQSVESVLALALVLAGNSAQAQKLTDSINQKFPLNTLVQNYDLPTVRAVMHLHANDAAGAIEILRSALKYDFAYEADGFNSLYPAYIRGLAYLQIGDGVSAAVEFKKLIDHPGIVERDVDGALALLQMARAQKMGGDKVAARKYYEQFLLLWKDADSDIPAYREAKAEYAKLASSH